MKLVDSLLVTLVFLLGIGLALQAVVHYEVSKLQMTGNSVNQAASISICITPQPSINFSDCEGNGTQGYGYECWLNSSEGSNLSFSREFVMFERAFNNLETEFFNVTEDGYINFTPSNDDVGNFTVRFYVNATTECGGTIASNDLNLTIDNVNDPPRFTQNISDISFGPGVTLHAFYVHNHFMDPDLDELYYNVSGNSQITIEISNTSQVIISSAVCDITEFVKFWAVDPYNDTNSSNLVKIKCSIRRVDEDDGGGSGGSSSSYSNCTPKYECYDEKPCNISNLKVQRCIDLNGCKREKNITLPCNYKTEGVCNESWECGEWEPCLPNGSQTRNCVDIAKCESIEYRPNLWQPCRYMGTCNDNIKNCHDGSCECN